MSARQDVIGRLVRWYAARCDGQWEHAYGITIGTLDNPGWSIRIDLRNTGLDPGTFARVVEGEGDKNYGEDGAQIGPWLTAWAEDGVWHAACGPDDLERALTVFLDWVDAVA